MRFHWPLQTKVLIDSRTGSDCEATFFEKCWTLAGFFLSPPSRVRTQASEKVNWANRKTSSKLQLLLGDWYTRPLVGSSASPKTGITVVRFDAVGIRRLRSFRGFC